MDNSLLNDTPIWLLVLLVIAGSILLALGLTALSRGPVQRRMGEGHNDMVAFATTGVLTIFGVLSSFVAVAVWDNYSQADTLAAQEAAVLIATYRDTQSLPEPVQQITRERLLAYAYSVVQDDWPSMRRTGRGSLRTESVLAVTFHDTGKFKPTSGWQTAEYAAVLAGINRVAETRANRLALARHSLPSVFWLLLLEGAVTSLLCGLLFQTERLWLQVAAITAITVVVSSSLLLILVLNHPYGGQVAVTPESFERAISLIAGSQ